MKLLVRNAKTQTELEIEGNYNLKNKEFKNMLIGAINRKFGTAYKAEETEIIDMRGKHVCKYCGEVTQGENADLLCSECREIFGHAFYSEL